MHVMSGIHRCSAPSGLGWGFWYVPGALPQAITVHPFGAAGRSPITPASRPGSIQLKNRHSHTTLRTGLSGVALHFCNDSEINPQDGGGIVVISLRKRCLEIMAQMTYPLKITAADRFLYFAVHPDDESLGGAGLIQQALLAGAVVRVIFVTDGDRNPWPQRLLEGRLTIGAHERARWGRRRRVEALNALAQFGLCPDSARFLGWPDQGVTELLLRSDETAVSTICKEVEDFKPTVLILPSAQDTHPDHNAFHVLATIASGRLRERGYHCPQLTYLIHTRGNGGCAHGIEISLPAAQVQVKRQAIECHQTQMLSRRRFLAYASGTEKFGLSNSDDQHPISSAIFSNGALRLVLDVPGLSWLSRPVLFLAFETLLDGSPRWALPLPLRSGRSRLRDAHTGKHGREATVRIKGSTAKICIPVTSAQPIVAAFMKLAHRPFFFDLAGWKEIPVLSLEEAAFTTQRADFSRKILLHDESKSRP